MSVNYKRKFPLSASAADERLNVEVILETNARSGEGEQVEVRFKVAADGSPVKAPGTLMAFVGESSKEVILRAKGVDSPESIAEALEFAAEAIRAHLASTKIIPKTKS